MDGLRHWLRAEPDLAVAFLCEKMPTMQVAPPYMGLLIHKDDEDEPIGGIVFDEIGDRDASIHIAFDEKAYIPRHIWTAALAFPFQVMRLNRITAWIRADNLRAIDIATRCGFELEGRKKRGARDGSDLVMLGLVSDTPTGVFAQAANRFLH